MYKVASRGPDGPAVAELKNVPEVDIYVAELSAKGHQFITVQDVASDPKPYEAWRAAYPGPRAKATDL